MRKVYVRFYATVNAFNNSVEYSVETEDSLRKRYRQSKDRDDLNAFLAYGSCAGDFVIVGPDIVFCRESEEHAPPDYKLEDDLFEFNMDFKDGMG